MTGPEDRFPLDPAGFCAALYEAVVPDTLDEMGLVSIAEAEKASGRDLSSVREQLPGANLVIVIVKRLDPALLAVAPAEPYQREARSVFECLCRCAPAVVRCLENAGYRAAWPGAQKVKHQKCFAVAAGLGELGDNMLFVSRRFGPGVQLETVLADVPLEALPPVVVPDGTLCLHCGTCVGACPAGAISPMAVDREKCRAYRQAVIKGYCGICMRSCVRTGQRME